MSCSAYIDPVRGLSGDQLGMEDGELRCARLQQKPRLQQKQWKCEEVRLAAHGTLIVRGRNSWAARFLAGCRVP
jgi:hypothetical protein